jgi:hypothetical protein
MPYRLNPGCLLAAALWLPTAPAFGQGTSVTAYAGYRSSGQGLRREAPVDEAVRLGAGVAGSVSVDWAIDHARQLQLFGSHQRSELQSANSSTGTPQRIPIRLSLLHIGGTSFVDGQVGRGTYVVGGLGVTQLTPSLAGYAAELRLSMNLGLGYQWPLAPALALRTELRGYGTLINSTGSFLCSGGCTVSIKGESLTQAELMLGLTWGF